MAVYEMIFLLDNLGKHGYSIMKGWKGNTYRYNIMLITYRPGINAGRDYVIWQYEQ